MDSFEGRIAFVTGAASGIGLAITRGALQRGMSVMMSDLDEDRLASAMETLCSDHEIMRDKIAVSRCDVSVAEDVKGAVAQTAERFGGLHLMCNNAGITCGGLVADLQEQDWDWAISVNLRGAINGCAAALPVFAKQAEGGHIVNTASMAGLIGGMEGWGPYQTTKYGIIGLTEVMRAEGRKRNYSASALCAGNVDTALLDSPNYRPDRFGPQRTPAAMLDDPNRLKKGMQPDDVAALMFDGVAANRRLIITHPGEYRRALEARQESLLRDLAWASEQPNVR